jgi:threonine dehydratase
MSRPERTGEPEGGTPSILGSPPSPSAERGAGGRGPLLPNSSPPTRADLLAARERVRGNVHHTPVLTCWTLDQLAGARLFFKAENFQKVGAFKYRGAWNAVSSLSPEERQRGVVTQSSGNHAQALALAAREHGAKAFIVMPDNAPAVKVAAVRGYGAEITFCQATPEARDEATRLLLEKTGGVLIHPFDDARIIAGQSTATQELLEAEPELDLLVAPVGGGGLLSGTALAARFFGNGRVAVWGGEPAGADDAHRSLSSGTLQKNPRVDTIADGLRTYLSPLTFSILRQEIEQVVTVSEDEIVAAMRLVWERMKIVIEPSAAVALAAVLRGEAGRKYAKIGIILSGGNVDLDHLPWK